MMISEHTADPIDTRIEAATHRTSVLMAALDELTGVVRERTEARRPPWARGPAEEINWVIPPGQWTAFPPALLDGGRCWVYGIPSMRTPGRCSKALFHAEPTRFALHRHPYRERICIIRGRGAYWTERTGEVPIAPGDVYDFDPYEAHAFVVTEEMEAFLWFWPGENGGQSAPMR